MRKNLVVVAHNIRSCYNVGTLFRTAECLGVKELLLTGYTPYPQAKADKRLPHIADRNTRQIQKTALGAEQFVSWRHTNSLKDAISTFVKEGYKIVALEQSLDSVNIKDYMPPDKLVLILGNERTGLTAADLALCDTVIEIPMSGQKESLNVMQAAAIALYTLREA